MDGTAQALLIVVSSVLSVFLILASVAAIFLIRTLRRVNQMADKAEQMADKVESAAEAVRNTATAVPFVKLLGNIMNWNQKRKRKKV